MYKYIKAVDEEDLKIGASLIISVKDEEIALFNYKGKYFAIANKCLHMGSPLAEGRIEEGILICPNHEWRYELETGYCRQNPSLKTKVYPVKVARGAVWIGFKKEEDKVLGKEKKALPAAIKFSVSTIQKPINPDEEL